MLIAVYNEDVINDKNQIAVNTSKFINDRLIIIERELGSVDANIESFKRENQLTDIRDRYVSAKYEPLQARRAHFGKSVKHS